MIDTLKEWTTSTTDEILMVLLSAVVTFSVILLYTRMAGLRSFSKMSAAVFAMTVAVGSLFASIISSATPTLLIGIISLGTLFAGQLLIAWLRRKYNLFCKIVDNEPLLLMAGKKMIDENLENASVTRADVYGKIREANALNYEQVLAVVLETTGDISVLHSPEPNAKLEADFLQNVIGHELLFSETQESGKYL